MSLVIISHPECRLHDMGPLHPERPERLTAIETAIKNSPLKDSIEFLEAPYATKENLLEAHTPKYIEAIFKLSPKSGLVYLDGDTSMGPFTLNAALRAAGSVIYGVDLIMHRNASRVFCNVRPPGHHAEHNLAMGFCLFNNVAIGVNYLLHHYPITRIAIIDFDVHHGNGTEDILKQEERVLFCSSYQHPFYPGNPVTQNNDHILHIPLEAGTTGATFREQAKAVWFPRLEAFKPQFVFFSAGFDAHQSEILAGLRFVEEDYYWITEEVIKLTKQSTKGRYISVLEGGYNLDALGASVVAHLNALNV